MKCTTYAAAAEEPHSSPQMVADDTPCVSQGGRLLVENGAEPTAQTKDGETPLHGASEGGYVELTWPMIEHGADVAARTKDRENPETSLASFDEHTRSSIVIATV